MRLGWCCIMFLLAASLPVLAGDEDEPVEDRKLLSAWQAEVGGFVRIGALVLGSTRSVTLVLSNSSDREVAIDVCGTVLKPRRTGFHHLALGPAEHGKRTAPGTSVVVVPPRRRVFFRIGAVRLDPKLPLSVSREYLLDSAELPPKKLRLLRWWADHPTCEQRLVEDAVRKGLDRVPIEDDALPLPGAPAGCIALSCSGVYYTLVRGELSSVDVSGARRVLAGDVLRAFPLPGCLYAIRAGESGGSRIDALGVTGGGGWEPLPGFSIEEPEEFRRLTPRPEGGLVVLTGKDLRFWSRKAGEQAVEFDVEDCMEVSCCVESTGRVLIAVNRLRQGSFGQLSLEMYMCELWEIPRREKQARLVRTFWEVRSLAAGAAGVYGLYRSGTLRRFHRNGLDKMPSQTRYASILRVGRKGLWLTDEEGEIVYADARSGRPGFRSGVKIETVIALDLDPETDDLAFTRDDGFCRMRPAGDGVEVIRRFED